MTKKNFDNVAEGFFTTSTETKIDDIKISTQIGKDHTKIGQMTKKKAGRPRAQDLKENEQIFKSSIYLTDETQFLIDSYALNKRIDRSEAIRQLIRKYAK